MPWTFLKNIFEVLKLVQLML